MSSRSTLFAIVDSNNSKKDFHCSVLPSKIGKLIFGRLIVSCFLGVELLLKEAPVLLPKISSNVDFK